MDRLGPTIPLIAREKAAIIERGDLAVTGATGDGARGRPPAGAADRRAADRGRRRRRSSDWDRDGLEVELPRLGRTRVGLRGRHQAANVAVADAVLDALEAAGIARVGDDARRPGYAGATLAGSAGAADRRRRSGRAPRRRPQPGRRGGPRRRPSTTCGRYLDARVPLTARDGVDGRQGRRRRDRARSRRRAALADARVICDRRSTCPARMPAAELADRWRAARPGGPAPSSPRTRAPRSTGRWRRRRARSSWPARSTSSAPSAPASSTTRCCATRADEAR